jgi:hypothetical protein
MEDFFGFCVRSGSPYVPGITELGRYCFKDGFAYCPISEAPSAENEEKESNKKTWLHDIYSDPLVLLKRTKKVAAK